ncbi:MAG: helix-turn-helix domain-containing protein [Halobacteriaceae archaeon]
MAQQEARDRLAERIAGEVVLSADPGATLRKWRSDFDVSQSALASELDISPSVVSDYEAGRREHPGVGLLRRYVEALLAIDERRGSDRIRQYARVVEAGFSGDAVLDLREYSRALPLEAVEDAVGATRVVDGEKETVNGHTVIDSIAAISQLSTEEFVRLYGRSTSRVLVFTGVSRGESPLVALRVVSPTPNAVVIHGIEPDELWEHAPALARRDGCALSVSNVPLETLLDGLRSLDAGR